MRLLFKQKVFSWLDSYDIFNEAGEVVYRVKGRIGWSHTLVIYDALGNTVGVVKQKILALLRTFYVYKGDVLLGTIKRKFTFLKPAYAVDFCGWQVEGDLWAWNYRLVAQDGRTVATLQKQLANWSDTYVMDIADPQDAFAVLAFTLAMDADKCIANDP